MRDQRSITNYNWDIKSANPGTVKYCDISKILPIAGYRVSWCGVARTWFLLPRVLGGWWGPGWRAQWACITFGKARPAGRHAHILRDISSSLFSTARKPAFCSGRRQHVCLPRTFSTEMSLKRVQNKSWLVLLFTRCAEIRVTHGTLLSDKHFTGKSCT